MDGGGKGGREGEEDDLNLGWIGRRRRRRGEQEQERASPLVGKAAAEERRGQGGAGQGRAGRGGARSQSRQDTHEMDGMGAEWRMG